MGTAAGRRPALTGLWVDQARLWAEPHATRLIFLPAGEKKTMFQKCCLQREMFQKKVLPEGENVFKHSAEKQSQASDELLWY